MIWNKPHLLWHYSDEGRMAKIDNEEYEPPFDIFADKVRDWLLEFKKERLIQINKLSFEKENPHFKDKIEFLIENSKDSLRESLIKNNFTYEQYFDIEKIFFNQYNNLPLNFYLKQKDDSFIEAVSINKLKNYLTNYTKDLLSEVSITKDRTVSRLINEDLLSIVLSQYEKDLNNYGYNEFYIKKKKKQRFITINRLDEQLSEYDTFLPIMYYLHINKKILIKEITPDPDRYFNVTFSIVKEGQVSTDTLKVWKVECSKIGEDKRFNIFLNNEIKPFKTSIKKGFAYGILYEIAEKGYYSTKKIDSQKIRTTIRDLRERQLFKATDFKKVKIIHFDQYNKKITPAEGVEIKLK
jgi:hypothetical protein